MPPKPSSTNPNTEKKRERGVAGAAARILQRDLGIGGIRGGRGGRRGGTPQPGKDVAQAAQSAPSGAPQELAAPSKESSADPKAKSSTPIKAVAPTSGPAASQPSTNAVNTNIKAPPSGPSKDRVQNSVPTSKAPVVPPATSKTTAPKAQISLSNSASKQAFLKHANPSQGVTEPLLAEAFATFGKVEKVEIDKKKGFAYVDFDEPHGLLQALRASPVDVGQGQVVVLERKVTPHAQTRGSRGGGPKSSPRGSSTTQISRGGRGGTPGRGGRQRAQLSNPSTSAATGSQGSNPLPNPIPNPTDHSMEPNAAVTAPAPPDSAAPPLVAPNGTPTETHS